MGRANFDGVGSSMHQGRHAGGRGEAKLCLSDGKPPPYWGFEGEWIEVPV